MNIEQKAIEHIEEILDPNFMEDMEFQLYHNKRDFTQDEAKKMVSILGEIYKTAHSANKEHSCYDVHEDWRSKYTKEKWSDLY